MTVREVAFGTYGAWRLALFDRNGLVHFENTAEACLRSFHVAAIAAPLYAVLEWIRLADMELASGPFRIALVEAIAYVIDWTAFPLVLWSIAQFLDRSDRYFRYIAAYNWSQLLQIGLMVVIALVASLGGFSRQATSAASLFATLAILVYQWFIAKTALELRGPAAVGIVLINVVISLILHSIMLRMI
jgi:hypothetical protein